MRHALNVTLMNWGWSRCRRPCSAFSVVFEPPYAEPHVRWCERTGAVRLPPTRLRTAAVNHITHPADSARTHVQYCQSHPTKPGWNKTQSFPPHPPADHLVSANSDDDPLHGLRTESPLICVSIKPGATALMVMSFFARIGA